MADFTIPLLWITVVLVVFYIDLRSKHKRAFERFKGIEDVDKELAKVKKDLDITQSTYKKISDDYTKNRKTYEELLKQIEITKDDLELVTYGFYQPHFEFDSSEEYKERILDLQALQKRMLREKTAASSPTKWIVEGSTKKGEQFIAKNAKLMIRAFNGEADSAILKVRWNNKVRMEERIKKAYQDINKLGESVQIQISQEYLNLKLRELELVYEQQEKTYQEREEQRQIREQMREEEKAQRELEKAQKDAELEELRKEDALIKARRELEAATGEELNRLNEQVALLEQQLKEAREKRERAISMAQQTKIGHIYVISNIGSFGEDVYKIGMTRRLEPMDRVRELGDASVPFEFDVHAIIYSQNAPELENKLHRHFDDKRVNLVNYRKEFFNVSLEEIEDAVKDLHGDFDFTLIAEAKQYRETLALREPATPIAAIDDVVEREFPESI